MVAMHMSAELFAQIVGAFECTTCAPHEGWNNRARPRLGARGAAVIVPLVDRLGRRPLRVAVRDLSTVGVGIVADTVLRAGEQFALRLPLTDQAPLWVVCTVARFQPMADDCFAIGSTFSHVLTTSARDEHAMSAGFVEPCPRETDAPTHA